MNNSIYDCLMERNKKTLKILYPIYFLLILLLIGCFYIKNIVAIGAMAVVFLIFSVLFFRILFKMLRLNNRQMEYNHEIGKEKYKDMYK